MSLAYWTLVGHTPIECDMLEWAHLLEDGRHVLEQTKCLTPDQAEVLVSTVFLGIDHSFSARAILGHPDHVPDLFETMVFGPEDFPDADLTIRTRSWDEAMEMHRTTVEAVVAGRAA